MKKLIIALAAAGFSATPALAGSELQTHCEGYVAENGGDASGCACLGDSADADVTAELLSVETEADLEALSDAAKETVAGCFPDAA